MKKKFDPGKTALLLIVINMTQTALIAATLLYIVDAGMGSDIFKDPWVIILLAVMAAVIIINSLSAFRSRSALIRSGHEFKLLEDTLARLENLNSTLRAQRHDFMNHLQVVHSLIEMDEYREADEYIEKVYGDIKRVSRIMKTSVAAVNALLQAKLLACEKQGIIMELDVRTQMKELKIPSWELCRVFGNLIDNAIYALNDIDSGKIIKIELYEDLRYYYFRVMDNGMPIHDDIAGRIFEAGFTTKGSKGEGMGLSISKAIMENYAGSISASREGDWTVFAGSIPR